MGSAVTSQALTPTDRSDLLRLVARVESISTLPALSDQSRLWLEHGDLDALVVATVRDPDGVAAFALLAPANDTWSLDVVVAPGDRMADTKLDELVADGIDALVARGNAPTSVTWWSSDTDTTDPSRTGFELDRELFQLRRRLPTGRTADVETRSFVPGRDDADLLAVNNRAFAGHPEQGGWTTDTLALRAAQEWFDPDGIRLHRRDGRLAGFCWTKVHPAPVGGDEPTDGTPTGEIYVIAVDPEFGGQGLGTQLTLAGLDHLAAIGITEATLWVDAQNAPAVAMYERLEFTRAAANRSFVRRISAPAKPPPPDPTDQEHHPT